MNLENWLEIGFGLMFVAALIFGLKWKQAKTLLKEVAEALTATSAALDDDDISAKERTKLLKEWGDVILAAKSLIGK